MSPLTPLPSVTPPALPQIAVNKRGQSDGEEGVTGWVRASEREREREWWERLGDTDGVRGTGWQNNDEGA